MPTTESGSWMGYARWIFGIVRAFYDRYKRPLPIIGGLIVAGTFVTHDYFREDAKDLADSLGRAKDAFEFRREISSQDQTLQELREKVNRLYDQLTPSDAIKKTNDEQKTIRFFAILFDQYATNQVGDRSLLENIRDLRSRLPRDAVFHYKVEPVEMALKKRGDLIDDLRGNLFVNTALNLDRIVELQGQLDKQRLPMEVFPESILKLVPSARDHNTYNADAHLAVEWLAIDTFSVANELSKRADATSDFWKIASIWLYSLGFILGLGGQLVGVDAGTIGGKS